MAAGRPRIELDETQIEKLAGMMCSVEEIGAVLGCSADTLQRNYAAAMQRGRDFGKASLKRKQFEVAMKGNVTMLMWLGKVWMAQKEEKSDELHAQPSVQISNDQLLTLVKAARGEKSA